MGLKPPASQEEWLTPLYHFFCVQPPNSSAVVLMGKVYNEN